jgi:hypothetical protein
MDSSFLKELSPLVKEGAPLLASSLFGPAGGVILSLIESAFGGAKGADLINAITTNPNSKDTLRSVQFNHIEALATLDKSDVKDARTYSSNFHLILPILSIIASIGFFVISYSIFYNGLEDGEKHIGYLVVGTLIGTYNQIFSYYFGSSHTQYLQDIVKK